MSRGDRKPPGSGGRQITEDEARLWRHATQSLDKVNAKPRVASAPAPPPPRELLPAKGKPGAAPKRASLPAPPPAGSAKQRPPPVAAFDRRKARQIASGKVEIDATIDLHGARQAAAHGRLRVFLASAHAAGHRTVLVITGKGGDEKGPDRLDVLAGAPQRGVLRRSVPHWLEEPELRALVLSYTSAGVRHGGAGALYVRLRKGGRSDQPR